MYKCALVLVAVLLVLNFTEADRRKPFVTDAELQAGRARLRPTACKSVGLVVTRCVNSRSNECCSRECDSSDKCKCSGLGERCANDGDCCERSVGENTFKVPCQNRICVLQE